MDLIDTHVHLEDIENLDEALGKAEQLGITAIVTMGSDHETNLWVLKESPKHQREKLRIYPALGLHPWGLDTSSINVNIQLIKENIGKAVAVGEIGLDYWYKEAGKSPEKRELQRELFRRLLRIAEENRKPVSIHSRGAGVDCVDITIEAGVEKAVFHWFTGPLEALAKLLDKGYYISATPAAAYSKEHRKVVEKTPLENLLLETDSPVTYQGEPSEPAHVLKTLSAVSELKNVDRKTVAAETTENARLLFEI